ncbi:type I secretion system permease/ATPase [Roseibium salinum]|uniref:Type I secretion system permease/ATPase n=2 Tax=Roseibium salinum TaxID=1604349 RepID=A0ABT3R4S8_9HYPH|nr:type I secretion system permease/ATPase [Roseibium sp. DSM 29163]MCX2724085.1 type I secretion system permease/ATPase [Roseibium sp. DSM 29163]
MPEFQTDIADNIVWLLERIGVEARFSPGTRHMSDASHYPCLVWYDDGTFQFEPAKPVAPMAGNRRVLGTFSLFLVYLNDAARATAEGSTRIERNHWLFGPMQRFWRGYVSIGVAAFFINTLALASPLFIMNVYDRVLPNKATSTLLALAVGVGLAMVFDFLLRTARSSIIDKTARELDRNLSYRLFDKVLHSKLEEASSSTGEYASRISQIEFVREFFASNTLVTLIDALFIFVFLVVIYLVAGWLFIIPAIAFVLATAVGLVAQARIGRKVARAANESSQRQSLLVESLSTLETIKSLRAEAALLANWTLLTKNASGTSEEIKGLSSGVLNLTQLIQQLVSVFVVIAGAYEFSEGNLTTGAIIATVMLSSRTVAPLSQIAMTLARLKQAILSLKILDGIMSQSEERPSGIGFVNRPVVSGDFAFQNVTFRYPRTDTDVLNKVSFAVKTGERVGIIGKIGSGKTTLGRILTNLYSPADGRILINGIDARQYHPAELRSAIAYVGQTVDLFTGTLKYNLQLANPGASDQELIEAAQKTGVDEFAMQHPRGYDLMVGERGSSLSGGQRQAVALTRLLLAKPKIVFLDEPSGSLDLATERRLIGNLARIFGPDVSLVISTHRYSLLELVDRLIVLDRGNIVADGPKDKVLEAMKAQARSVQAQ